MGLELELDDEAAIFSATSITGRLLAPGEPIAVFRDTIQWGRDRLYGLFEEGSSAESLVRAQAFLIDEVLRHAWDRHLRDAEGLALAAVGGYGRGELLPHSDVDLLLLHEGNALEPAQSEVERFLAFLWDIGLDIGSSVRTVKECAKQAKDDITVATTLIEARHLAGDHALVEALEAALDPSRVWPVNEFFRAKVQEQEERHKKFDDSAYKLEPNVKESPGGLRDIHTIAWVAKRHFDARSLSELRDEGFLTQQECNDLFAGQDFLWRVRFAIHMITGRKEDRLLFDHQVRIAAIFGYVNSEEDRNAAVEQFMQLYYRTIKSLICLNDLLLQLFDEAILNPTPPAPKPLNARFQTRGGFIEARSADVFRRYPSALIEIFLLLQQHQDLKGIRAETLRLIRRDRKLVDEGLRNDVHARTMFMDMFRQPQGLTRALRRMNRYGVLGRYLPAFGQIIGHMQYDLFHTLTVDEHTLYMVRNLRRMAMPMFTDELPFASEVMERIDKKELLYLAGLFHDIGKGRGGDHSEVGARDAEQFCLDHGLSHSDADLVAWLVQNHLTMSITAQKQDVDDPEVVRAFAAKVGDRERLDYLYLLTCADIRATNPALWNRWRDSLLKTLYNASVRALERGVQHPISPEDVAREQKTMALALLKKANVDPKQAGAVWARFDDDYFLRHTPQELAWHLPHILEATEDSLPLVLVDTLATRGTTAFIYMRDRDQLFALTTGVLARMGLSILDARIGTSADGYTLDSFVVFEENSKIPSAQRNTEIRERLRSVLLDEEVSIVDVNRRQPARLRHFNTPTSVHFRQDKARGRTIMELVTADRPGLLSIIGRVFHRRRINLVAAKIGTMGERAEDVFFITNEKHEPITDPKALEQLRAVLTRTLHRGDFVAEEFQLTAADEAVPATHA